MSRIRTTRSTLTGLLVAIALTVTSCVNLPGVEVESPTRQGKARTGGTVKAGVLRPRALDPADASDRSSQLIVRTMCDTLLGRDPKTGALVPGIAEKWAPTAKYGQTRILLTLRKDVYFPDGRQVDARVVVESLSRLAREETAGSMSELLRDVQGFDHIQGGTEEPPERSREFLTGVRVSDPFGVEIVVETEDAGWVRRLANPATAIVDDTVGRKDPLAFARQPVCAGPYRLAAPWNPGDPVIRLVRNQHYSGSPWGYTRRGAGYAKEILFYVYEASDLAYQAYAEHKWIDIVEVPPELRAEAMKQSKDYVDGNSHHVVYVGLPAQPGNPFERRTVRVALSQAIDRKRIVADAYAGSTVAASGFLPPIVGSAYRENACGEAIPDRSDPERARQAMGSAAEELRGKKVPFYFFDGYQNAAIVGSIAESWKAAFGLRVEPTPLSEADFLARVQGGFDGPFLYGWDGEQLAEPQAYLRALVGSGEEGNAGNFTDPVLDRYFENDVAPFGGTAGDGLATEQEQVLALERAESRVCELMPLIPLTFVRTHWLIRDDRLGSARDFRLDRFGDPALRELWAKPTKHP
jgi:ABC-type transport system substrate-binding protein